MFRPTRFADRTLNRNLNFSQGYLNYSTPIEMCSLAEQEIGLYYFTPYFNMMNEAFTSLLFSLLLVKSFKRVYFLNTDNV